MNETDEQKQARETKRLHKIVNRIIKRFELLEKKTKFQKLQDALQNVNNKITGEKKKTKNETRVEARTQAKKKNMKIKQEAKNRAQQEMRER